MTQTVVITGASAGIARATARLYARRQANVALLARGKAGLEAAAQEVRQHGGTPLAIQADVAEPEQVDAAAAQVERELGPVDTWINVAFTSVFAPFTEISAAEFKRVTEVSYLGFVYGTMAALRYMKPRDYGTIVQAGSALGERSIPLQSAYCGVRITVVQMPAVNTPQFSWVRSRLPRDPQPVPPIYEPELAARGVAFAADHPGRKQYWVGDSTAATLLAQKFAAPLLDRYLARTGYDSQQTSQRASTGRPDNLWEPVDQPPGTDHGAHGSFDSRSHNRSPQLWLSQHARQVSAATATAATAAGLGTVLARRRSR
jgi:short chain dehydrogenase